VLQVRIFKLLYILLKIFEVYLFCAPGEGRATPGRRANPGRKPPPVYLHYHASHQSMDTIVNMVVFSCSRSILDGKFVFI
jgi:hypothetical protein